MLECGYAVHVCILLEGHVFFFRWLPSQEQAGRAICRLSSSCLHFSFPVHPLQSLGARWGVCSLFQLSTARESSHTVDRSPFHNTNHHATMQPIYCHHYPVNRIKYHSQLTFTHPYLRGWWIALVFSHQCKGNKKLSVFHLSYLIRVRAQPPITSACHPDNLILYLPTTPKKSKTVQLRFSCTSVFL